MKVCLLFLIEIEKNPEWFFDLEKGLNQFLNKGDWLYNFENENPQPNIKQLRLY